VKACTRLFLRDQKLFEGGPEVFRDRLVEARIPCNRVTLKEEGGLRTAVVWVDYGQNQTRLMTASVRVSGAAS